MRCVMYDCNFSIPCCGFCSAASIFYKVLNYKNIFFLYLTAITAIKDKFFVVNEDCYINVN